METTTETTTKTKQTKRSKGKVAKKSKSAKATKVAKTSKKKATVPSVAFNVSVPASLLPKIDKAARAYAKANGWRRASRSGYVRGLLTSTR